MSRQRENDCPPKPPSEAELIVKQSWECSSRFEMWFAPTLCIYGSRAGFQWLADYFAWLARSFNEDVPFDNDVHFHLDHDGPLNPKLSDMVGLKLVCMPSKHHGRILRSVGITQAARLKGSPITQAARVLDHIVARAITGSGLNEQDRCRLSEEIEGLIEEAETCLATLGQSDVATRSRAVKRFQRRRPPQSAGLFGYSLGRLAKSRVRRKRKPTVGVQRNRQVPDNRSG